MSNHLYNYSVSLIRRSNSSWIIDPVDSSAQAVYKEVLTLKPGNSYLAVKTVRELTYSILSLWSLWVDHHPQWLGNSGSGYTSPFIAGRMEAIVGFSRGGCENASE